MKAATTFVAGLFVSLLILGGSQAMASDTANVTVTNSSDWAIMHFFLSPADSEKWGPDQLGKGVIKTGGNFKLNNIPCDTYDVKLVDEDGDQCVVQNVDLCAAADHWVITSDELVDCQKKSGN
jgi:hypothetical protein